MKAFVFILKGIVNFVLIVIGTLAFMVILGEEAPGHELSVWAFFGGKILAGVVVYICFKVGCWLNPQWAAEMREENQQFSNK